MTRPGNRNCWVLLQAPACRVEGRVCVLFGRNWFLEEFFWICYGLAIVVNRVFIRVEGPFVVMSKLAHDLKLSENSFVPLSATPVRHLSQDLSHRTPRCRPILWYYLRRLAWLIEINYLLWRTAKNQRVWWRITQLFMWYMADFRSAIYDQNVSCRLDGQTKSAEKAISCSFSRRVNTGTANTKRTLVISFVLYETRLRCHCSSHQSNVSGGEEICVLECPCHGFCNFWTLHAKKILAFDRNFTGRMWKRARFLANQ